MQRPDLTSEPWLSSRTLANLTCTSGCFVPYTSIHHASRHKT